MRLYVRSGSRRVKSPWITLSPVPSQRVCAALGEVGVDLDAACIADPIRREGLAERRIE